MVAVGRGGRRGDGQPRRATAATARPPRLTRSTPTNRALLASPGAQGARARRERPESGSRPRVRRLRPRRVRGSRDRRPRRSPRRQHGAEYHLRQRPGWLQARAHGGRRPALVGGVSGRDTRRARDASGPALVAATSSVTATWTARSAFRWTPFAGPPAPDSPSSWRVSATGLTARRSTSVMSSMPSAHLRHARGAVASPWPQASSTATGIPRLAVGPARGGLGGRAAEFDGSSSAPGTGREPDLEVADAKDRGRAQAVRRLRGRPGHRLLRRRRVGDGAITVPRRRRWRGRRRGCSCGRLRRPGRR